MEHELEANKQHESYKQALSAKTVIDKYNKYDQLRDELLVTAKAVNNLTSSMQDVLLGFVHNDDFPGTYVKSNLSEQTKIIISRYKVSLNLNVISGINNALKELDTMKANYGETLISVDFNGTKLDIPVADYVAFGHDAIAENMKCGNVCVESKIEELNLLIKESVNSYSDEDIKDSSPIAKEEFKKTFGGFKEYS